MSTRRLNPIPPQGPERGPNGRGLCRGCGKEVPKGSRTWCSKACVEDAVIRAGHGSWIRPRVEERDKGVCALCGADTAKVERIVSRLRCSIEHRWNSVKETYSRPPWEFCEATLMAIELLQKPFNVTRWSTHWWEADHVVPVAEGGGGCGLDGYRTLCRPCHSKESGALRRRLNAKRKEAA